MAYIGKEPVNGFFTRQSLTTDGSTVTFTLNFTIASTTSILVLAGGVVQEPDVAYTLSGGGTAITFTSAPASNTDTYIHYLGQAVVQNILDVNGAGSNYIYAAFAENPFVTSTGIPGTAR